MTACSDSDDGGGKAIEPPTRIQLTGDESRAMEAGNEFAADFFDEAYVPGRNVAFSPISIQMALGMLANGADGQTLDEILDAIGDESSLSAVNTLYGKLCTTLPVTDGNTNLRIANSLWHTQSFSATNAFRSAISDAYGAALHSFDNANKTGAANDINRWISNATDGSITNMVSADVLADCMLINAISFKSLWAKPFDSSKTAASNFTNFDGSKSSVPMMNSSLDGLYAEYEGVEIARLAFGNAAFSMTFILPRAGQSLDDAVDDVLDGNGAAGSLRSCKLTVKLPKFEAECTISAKQALAELGIRRVFSPSEAELTGISGSHTYISDVLHSCCVEVDEEGAKAAAATITGLVTSAGPNGTASITLDRPFAYYISESSTGAILFIGAIDKL